MSGSGAQTAHKEFFNLSGAGNDFIALVEPSEPPAEHEIIAWCRRGLSLGADGLFTLGRRPGGARMVHYNADGGRSELCLNGSRCAAALAFHLGWGTGSELRLDTDAGGLRAQKTGSDRVALELPDIVGKPEPKTLDVDGEAHDGWLLTVGVPHFVLPWPVSLARAPVDRLGRILRAHPDVGDAGANVDFANFATQARCELRTFERGVEAETLACGTGVIATVAAGVAAGRLSVPAVALTAGGYELEVRGAQHSPWVIEGDARILARGELLDGASAVPPPPVWR